MGLLNYQQVQPFAPPEQRVLAPSVTHAVWYPLHESTGSTAECALGNGPDLTLNGTAGTVWSATFGAVTPNGVDHRFASPDDDAVLTALCRLDNIEGGEILIGFDLAHDGAMTATEGILSWGSNVNGAGRVGGWSLVLLSSTQMAFHSFAGEGASALRGSGFTSSAAAGITDRILSVVSIRGTGVKTVTPVRHSWRVGTGLGTPGVLAPSEVDLMANGGVGTYAGDDSKLTLCARQTNPTTFAAPLGATAGSNAKLGNVWLARFSHYQAGRAEQALLDMAAAPREFPITLRA